MTVDLAPAARAGCVRHPTWRLLAGPATGAVLLTRWPT
jgi:hypothetical protein